MLYPRTKGEIEAEIESLGFEKVSIFRPSVLERGADARWVERLSAPFTKFIPKYRAMPLDLLSRVMIHKCLEPDEKPVLIMENATIHQSDPK